MNRLEHLNFSILQVLLPLLFNQTHSPVHTFKRSLWFSSHGLLFYINYNNILTEPWKSPDEKDRLPKDFLLQLNDIEVFTSRLLKLNKPYILLNLSISHEIGFNGPYKKATSILRDNSRPTGTINVSLPNQFAKFTEEMVQRINDYARSGLHARYVVRSISPRSRLDGKGKYDLVDFSLE